MTRELLGHTWSEVFGGFVLRVRFVRCLALDRAALRLLVATDLLLEVLILGALAELSTTAVGATGGVRVGTTVV